MTKEERNEVIKLLEAADDYCWEIADYDKPTIIEGIEKAIDELKNYPEKETIPTKIYTVRDLLDKMKSECEIIFKYPDYSYICKTMNTCDGVIPYLDCYINEWYIGHGSAGEYMIILIEKSEE